MTLQELYPPFEQATMMEEDAGPWHDRMAQLMLQDTRIIALRGAGTVNGIDPYAADAAVGLLYSYVSTIVHEGTPVALLYDGDEDNPGKPDIGSVFGRLADNFRHNTLVTPLAAQSEGWYSPKAQGAALESVGGTAYETYIFPDTMPDGHAALTQSAELVKYAGYEQVVVGPAGPIALSQLKDLSNKTAFRPVELDAVKVRLLELPNNPALDNSLLEQLYTTTDTAARNKIIEKLAQRQAQPYGALFDKDGTFAVDARQYPGVQFDIATVWMRPSPSPR